MQLRMRGDKPDMLCFRYEPAMGKIALIIEAGDDEKGPVGSISFIQLVLLTCYETRMPADFSPEVDVIRARKSSNAAWKKVAATASSMSREFCWTKLDLRANHPLFSQEDITAKLTKRTNVCVRGRRGGAP